MQPRTWTGKDGKERTEYTVVMGDFNDGPQGTMARIWASDYERLKTQGLCVGALGELIFTSKINEYEGRLYEEHTANKWTPLAAMGGQSAKDSREAAATSAAEPRKEPELSEMGTSVDDLPF